MGNKIVDIIVVGAVVAASLFVVQLVRCIIVYHKDISNDVYLEEQSQEDMKEAMRHYD